MYMCTLRHIARKVSNIFNSRARARIYLEKNLPKIAIFLFC